MKLLIQSAVFIAALCVSVTSVQAGAAVVTMQDSTPVATVTKDAKTIIGDYIDAIGGLEAIKNVKSISDTGTLSVQGTSLDVMQEKLAPNKMRQIVMMNGTVVGKTVFNGTSGYGEQMGNRTDMADSDVVDMKSQTTLIEQVDYLTNPAYKLSVAGVEPVNGSDAYKVVISTPAGKTITEYYDKTSKLLVKKVMEGTVNGQDFVTTNGYSNYKKAGDIMLPHNLTVSISAGSMAQSFDIVLNKINVNEGVADADFND